MSDDLRTRAERAVAKAREAARAPKFADPHGVAARAAGIDPATVARIQMSANDPNPDKTTRLTLEGVVERNAKKFAIGGAASQGQAKISLKAGGTLTGELVLNYLNNAELAKLSKHDRRDQLRKFRVSITLEEITS